MPYASVSEHASRSPALALRAFGIRSGMALALASLHRRPGLVAAAWMLGAMTLVRGILGAAWSLIDVLDVGIVAFVVYRVLLLIKGTRAMQMLTGLGIKATISEGARSFAWVYISMNER